MKNLFRFVVLFYLVTCSVASMAARKQTYTPEKVIEFWQLLDERGLIDQLKIMKKDPRVSKLQRRAFGGSGDFRTGTYGASRDRFGSLEEALRRSFPDPIKYQEVYAKVLGYLDFWTEDRIIDAVESMYKKRNRNGTRFLPGPDGLNRGDKQINRAVTDYLQDRYKDIPRVEHSATAPGLYGAIAGSRWKTLKELMIERNLNWREVYDVKLTKPELILALRALHKLKKGEINYAALITDKSEESTKAIFGKTQRWVTASQVTRQTIRAFENSFDKGIFEAGYRPEEIRKKFIWVKSDIDVFVRECLRVDGYFVLRWITEDKGKKYSRRLKSLGIHAAPRSFYAALYNFYDGVYEAVKPHEDVLKERGLTVKDVIIEQSRDGRHILQRIEYSGGELKGKSPADQGLALFKRVKVSEKKAKQFFEDLAKQLKRIRDPEKFKLMNEVANHIMFQKNIKPLTVQQLADACTISLNRVVKPEEVEKAMHDLEQKVQKASLKTCP